MSRHASLFLYRSRRLSVQSVKKGPVTYVVAVVLCRGGLFWVLHVFVLLYYCTSAMIHSSFCFVLFWEQFFLTLLLVKMTTYRFLLLFFLSLSWRKKGGEKKKGKKEKNVGDLFSFCLQWRRKERTRTKTFLVGDFSPFCLPYPTLPYPTLPYPTLPPWLFFHYAYLPIGDCA